MKEIKYTIAIATFRRPAYLADLLQDLSHQEGAIDLSAWEVLVCDNDANETGKGVFDNAKFEKFGIYKYFSVKEQNISLARNKLFDEANGEALIYVDDDQRVKPGFCYQVAEFWGKYRERISGAKFQVTPIFDSPHPTWLRKTNFFEKHLPSIGEPIKELATNGCILKKTALTHLPLVFDPKLGRSGSEDFELFLRLKHQRHVFVSAASVETFERVPESRETINYLVKRNFFRSATYGNLMLMNYFPTPRLIDLFFMPIKFTVSFLLVLMALPLGKRLLLNALLLFIRQAGKLVGFFGFTFRAY